MDNTDFKRDRDGRMVMNIIKTNVLGSRSLLRRDHLKQTTKKIKKKQLLLFILSPKTRWLVTSSGLPFLTNSSKNQTN